MNIDRREIGTVSKLVVASALTFGALGATAGGVIDHLASEGIHRTWYDEDGYTYTYDDAEAKDAEAKDGVSSAETRAEVYIRDLLDDRCRVAVEPYRLDGEFADVPEEGAIDDLIAEPDLPCQGRRSQIRAIIRLVRAEDAKIQQQRDYAKETSEDLAIFTEYIKDDRNFNGLLAGGVIFGALGLFRGSQVARRRTGPQQGHSDPTEGAA